MRKVAVPAGGFRNVAVLRLSSLGDVVLTLPVVHALARAWPAAQLHYWVKEEYADVVSADPAVAHVRRLERDTRLEDLVSMSAELEDCDLIVDLHGNARTRVLTFRQRAPVLRVRGRRLQRERWVRARWTGPRPLPHATVRYAEAIAPLGIAPAGPPRVHVPAAAEAWAQTFLEPLPTGARPVLALCPGARHATKRWPEARWCALDERLAAAGHARVVLSTEAERRALPALAARVAADASARWVVEPLARVAALLGRCALAVTHDSGLMHLAAGRGTRVVALFGSTSPVLGFAPVGEGHAVLCRDLPCQPCTLHGLERCPRGHFRCMTTIEPDEVWNCVRERIAP